MFKVYLTNFYYFLDGDFTTLEEAKHRGRKAGFEFSILKDGNTVAAWSVFGGFHNL